jgi:UDP-N-acetylmuramyl pentapeptide phosphotransferase/UDP-N-acetylglucosamine-1-phosphate transferase
VTPEALDAAPALVAAVVSAVVSALACAALRPILARRALAEVTARSDHGAPTPQGGGLGVVLGMLAGLAAGLVALWPSHSPHPWPSDAARLAPLLAAVGAVAALGLADDLASRRGGLSPRLRLAVQGAAAAGLALGLHGSGGLAGAVPGGLAGLAALAVTVVGVVWLVNLVNFIDGSDLITVAHAAPALGGLGVALAGGSPAVGLACIAAAAAFVGFATLNRPPARLFLGDCGSYAAGILLAGGGLVLAAAGRPALVLALIAYPATDATLTLARRLAAGRPPAAAHRDHYYQRARRRGWSAGKVAAFAALPAAPGLFAAFAGPAWDAAALALAAGAALAVCLAYNGGLRRALAA